MTREEAIAEIRVIWERLSHPEDCENGCYSFRDGDYLEALDMAIESLQREEAEEKGWCHRIRPKNVEVVVRCKDCKHYIVEGITTRYGWCHEYKHSVDEDDYCSYGERREGSEVEE